MKFRIQRDYRNDVHYVWCSEHFDSKKLGAYAPGSRTARSADPAAIYRELAEDVATGDLHSAKIASLRASLKELAIEERASVEKEYIIRDLQRSDFEIIEP